jgi:hypothetical protein
MAKPYSNDLRARVVSDIAEGATLAETADHHHVSLSSVVRFLRLKRTTGQYPPHEVRWIQALQFGGVGGTTACYYAVGENHPSTAARLALKGSTLSAEACELRPAKCSLRAPAIRAFSV